MSEHNMRALIEHASNFAEVMLRDEGNVAPIWHMITQEGEQLIELMPPCKSKDDAVLLMRALMAVHNVVRYVYFSEAWMLDLKGEDAVKAAEEWRRGLERHPDRIEVVAFQAEDESGSLSGHRRIIRGKGRPHLGPLQILRTDECRGRMVGLLPKPKGTRLQ